MPRTETRFLETPDGARLAWHLEGNGDPEALRARPTVLLTNGIGTSENFWRFLVAELGRDHRVAHWNYRGHGASSLAGARGYDMRTQADDLVRVTEAVMAEGDGRPPHHVAFSMGVTVLLEAIRVRPELAPSLTLVAGAPDAPGASLLPPSALSAIRVGLTLVSPLVPHLRPVWRTVLGLPFIYSVGRVAGILQRHTPREDIDRMMQAMQDMDPSAWWETLRGFAAADAMDVLPFVQSPVQIIAAGRDLFMPLRQIERMRDGLPGAEWLLLPDTGHATLVERGPEIAAAVRGFMGRHGAS